MARRSLTLAPILLCLFMLLLTPSSPATGNGVTPTSAAALPAADPCSAVAPCSEHPQCNSCLVQLNAVVVALDGASPADSYPYADNTDDETVLSAVLNFFNATPACTTGATLQYTLGGALSNVTGACPPAVSNQLAFFGKCVASEYLCFITPSCRPCLPHILSSDWDDGGKSDSVGSPACVEAMTDSATVRALNALLYDCPTMLGKCTVYKLACAHSPACARCLGLLDAGDGAAAARECGSPQTWSYQMDNVVGTCTSEDPVACAFNRERCESVEDCAACLSGLAPNFGTDTHTLAKAFDTPACQRLLGSGRGTHLSYLLAVFFECWYPKCQAAVAACVAGNPSCYECLASPRAASLAGGNVSAACGGISPADATFIANHVGQCAPCPESVRVVYVVVLATAVIGGASAAVCVAVVVTIVAHGHDRVSMRERIIAGLMVANAVYSTANAIPLNQLHTGSAFGTCGQLALPYHVIRFGRAWWFAGKYGLVAFELFILGASTWALLWGMPAVPPRVEAALHGACGLTAALAFVAFFVQCETINAAGYNSATARELATEYRSNIHADDDRDDDAPDTGPTLRRYEDRRDAYDALVRSELVVWDVLAGLALALWLALRLLHRRSYHSWTRLMREARDAEAADQWASTRRSAWQEHRAVLEAHRSGFTEIARPLEPYVLVLVLFGVPAAVMSTRFCADRSGAYTPNQVAGFQGIETRVKTCDVWCELVLSFRSLCTVAVFLLPRRRRAELADVRATWRKLCARLARCCGRSGVGLSRAPPAGAEDGAEQGLVLLDARRGGDGGGSGGGGDGDRAPPAQLSESDVAILRRLGAGSFGDVWECRLRGSGRRAAVKVLKTAEVDDDGDPVLPDAEEDFRRECAALQRVSSPHLIELVGFGVTSGDRSFIVTELMAGGSLEAALGDTDVDLPWRTRVSVALQVALGMTHLHSLHMLHRDLKSANVLLDKALKIAKVCDFGLVRVGRPTPRRVLYSPFTGVAMEVTPQVACQGLDLPAPSLSPCADVRVTVADAAGKLTRAPGTLLWMAPEVFRGDTRYGPPVDVYSFGVVLWELATRQTPWSELDNAGDKVAVFFAELNRALQTGRRPVVPAWVTVNRADFVAVMRRCWAGDPADRPSFSDVTADLAVCLRTICAEDTDASQQRPATPTSEEVVARNK